MINREDVDHIWRSIDLINAYIYFKYDSDENVIICDNSKLYDSRFRYDKLHLTDPGISILASNLKYGIAKSLQVKVLKKNRVQT